MSKEDKNITNKENIEEPAKTPKEENNISNLAKALSAFQGEVRNAKNSAENPFFKSSYAPLEVVLDTVRPTLSKYGLSIVQIPVTSGAYAGVKTILMHESGEKIETPTLALVNEKGNAQGAGSAITYARRYAISSVLGIASEDDDDANSISVDGGNDFNTLMTQAKKLGGQYYNEKRMDELTKITEKHFGKGKKLVKANPSQIAQLKAAVEELHKNL